MHSFEPTALTGKPLPPLAIHYEIRYNSVRVGWTEPWSSVLLPILNYQVQLLNSDGSIIDQAIVSVGSSGREKRFENLINQMMYNIRVAAVNAVGQSDWSPLVPITTPLPDGMPFYIDYCPNTAHCCDRKLIDNAVHGRVVLTGHIIISSENCSLMH